MTEEERLAPKTREKRFRERYKTMMASHGIEEKRSAPIIRFLLRPEKAWSCWKCDWRQYGGINDG